MTATGEPTVRRTVFTTSDADQARGFLDEAYGGQVRLSGTDRAISAIAVTHTDAGLFQVADFSLPADLTFTVDGTETVIVSTIIEGAVQADRAAGLDRYQAGDVLLGSLPDGRYTCHTHSLCNHNFALPVTLLYSVADTGSAPAVPLRFISPDPVSAAARTQWLAMTSYIDGLLAEPMAAAAPLVISSATQLLAATVLTIFPNNVLISPTSQDRHDGHPATLRRAVSYIDAHAHQDITVADIASAANVTIRAVQLAFRRHLGTTPMSYLRRVRLAHAHRDLVAADPTRQTVTSIAFQWGFDSPSRFAALYRQAYGVNPGQTLRRG